jgi:hypothetical protein
VPDVYLNQCQGYARLPSTFRPPINSSISQRSLVLFSCRVKPPPLLSIHADAMAPIPLDSLPQEILARIASSGPAESVLALAKTCRTLYRACYDTLVFKAVIECQRPLWQEPKMLDVPTLSRYIRSEDTQAWARFAVADQRAMEFRDRMGPSDGMQVASGEYINLCNTYAREGLENWAPHLFVARCKFKPDPARKGQGTICLPCRHVMRRA